MKEGDFKMRWSRFVASKQGRRVLKGAQVLFALGIVAYLIYELRGVSWAEITAALPVHPLFYVLLVVIYFLVPFAELWAYRITWVFDARRSVAAFLKKRIYNTDVLGYSGELYFYTWARKNVGLPDLEILKTIRDQNIVSSAASTMMAVMLVAIFLYTGQINVLEWMGRQETAYLVGGAVVLAVLATLAVQLRKYLFSMAFKTANLIFIVHLARLVVGQMLQIGMWAVAMPEVPLPIWFTYAAASIVVTRIPFIPNGDLIFLGVGVSLSGMVNISEAGVFGMLGVIVILRKVLNVVLFSTLSLLDRQRHDAVLPTETPEPQPEPEPEPEEVF